MADISGNSNLSAETLTGAPPPPQEVKVRTMASDLASMAQSGGGLPQFENVKIAGVSNRPQDPQETARKTSLGVAILAIVVLVIVLVAGFVLYQSFQKAITVPGATSGSNP